MTERPPAGAAARLRRIRAALLRWYAVERRSFPWRGTSDPWAVLVSEVMLQQTQATRVAERFPPFLRRFPTPRAMAAAPEREVLAAWSGLGYNRRALALRRAADAVTRDGWPPDVAGLERLPGVGPYTARAVAALAYGRAAGVVDTNVRRWLIRRLGLPVTVSPRELQSWADALAARPATPEEAAAWVHASMEFGARVCRSRGPRCEACPVARGCPSRGRATAVPVARQPPFAGSSRAVRGALLRRLASAPDHALPEAEIDGGLPGAELEAVLSGLERDGLVHRAAGDVRLGPAPREPAATIGR
jgi:A/G-specific adenine glycosylase